MEFQIKNANGDVLLLCAVPGDIVLKFEVIPAPIRQSVVGLRQSEENLYSAAPSADGPPIELTK